MAYQDEDGILESPGTGLVEVAPDLGVVRLAVITEAETAAEAVQQNATRMQQVLAAVQALPHREIETVGLGVRPITTWDPDTRTASITGYRAENAVEVEVDVDQVAPVFDAGITAGANESSGIELRLSDETPHRKQALRLAYEEARAGAEAVAEAAGVTLGQPERITIDPASGLEPRRFEAAMLRAEASTPVLPGPLAVRASLRAAFRMRSSK